MLAVGPGGLDKDGKMVSCGVKPGDRVLIPQVGLSVSLSVFGLWFANIYVWAWRWQL